MFAQGSDLRQLLFHRGNFRFQAGIQANDRLVVQAAAVPHGGGAEPGVEGVGQLLEGEGLGHDPQASGRTVTSIDPFWLRASGGAAL